MGRYESTVVLARGFRRDTRMRRLPVRGASPRRENPDF
jgi:hypothetical protein